MRFACGRESWGCCSSRGCRSRLAGGCCSHPAAAPGQGRVSLSPARGKRRTRPGWAEGGISGDIVRNNVPAVEITMPWQRHQGSAGTERNFWRPLVPPALSQAGWRVCHQSDQAPSSQFSSQKCHKSPAGKASLTSMGSQECPCMCIHARSFLLILLLSKIHLESLSPGSFDFFFFLTACLAFKRQTLNPLHLRDSPKVFLPFPTGDF